MTNHDPIAYTYEADTHCPDCALKRFGRDARGFIAGEGARDSEGNEPGAIAPWDEWESCEGSCEVLVCCTCREIIEESHDAKDCDACLRESLENGAYFDRFDVCAAYNVFSMLWHGGQGSPEYALTSVFHRLKYRPARGEDTPRGLTENAHAIYARLALAAREGKCPVRDRR